MTEKQYVLAALYRLTQTLRGPVPFNVLQAYVYSDPHSPIEDLNRVRTVSYLVHQLEDEDAITQTKSGICVNIPDPQDSTTHQR